MGRSGHASSQADWGAQRVKNLSLFRAVWEAIKPKTLRLAQDKSKQVTSLIEEFNYPKYGPGMMWERCTEKVTAAGATVEFEHEVTKIRHDDGARVRGHRRRPTAAPSTTYPCTHVISSMPIGALLRGDGPAGRRPRWSRRPTTCATATS